jgi:hypothetical protein
VINVRCPSVSMPNKRIRFNQPTPSLWFLCAQLYPYLTLLIAPRMLAVLARSIVCSRRLSPRDCKTRTWLSLVPAKLRFNVMNSDLIWGSIAASRNQEKLEPFNKPIISKMWWIWNEVTFLPLLPSGSRLIWIWSFIYVEIWLHPCNLEG